MSSNTIPVIDEPAAAMSAAERLAVEREAAMKGVADTEQLIKTIKFNIDTVKMQDLVAAQATLDDVNAALKVLAANLKDAMNTRAAHQRTIEQIKDTAHALGLKLPDVVA